jgi:hypothetical protein
MYEKANMDISRINTRWIEGDTQPEEPVVRETTKEKVERQRRERVEQSDKTWEYVQANQDRYAKHRAEVLAKRRSSAHVYPFTDEALLDDAREVAREYQWDHSQQRNTRLAVLTPEEANEYLDVKLGHALNTVKGNVTYLKGNVYVEVIFSGAVNAVDYMLHDEKTLGEVVGQFSADVAKGVVTGVIAQGFTLLVSGVIATFVAPPTVAVLGVFAIAAFGIGFVVSEIDDEYNFTEPMKREIEKIVNEN